MEKENRRQGCDEGQAETRQSRGQLNRGEGGEKKMEYKDQWPRVCD